MHEEDNTQELEKIVKKSVKKANRSNRIFNIITRLILPLLIIGFLGYSYYNLKKSVDRNFTFLSPANAHDLTLEDHGVFGYKAVDFSKVILGKAQKESLLIVDEQNASVNSTVTDAGFLKLGIFSKNQNITYYGKGIYTIDLSKLTEDDISLDDSDYTVTITVPYPELHEVSFDPNKTVVGDVDRGWLAFGDISMTADETKKVQSEAVKRLKASLSSDECFETAVRYTKLSATELFQPVVESVSPAYKVKVEVAQKPLK